MSTSKKLNLRLTPAQHRQLEQWAKDSERSMQGEAVYRLFKKQAVLDVQLGKKR